jgi:hypothetical protein
MSVNAEVYLIVGLDIDKDLDIDIKEKRNK